MPDICSEKHKQIDRQLDTNCRLLDRHGTRIDIVEQKLVAQEKDTTHLQQAIIALNRSIDKLIDKIGNLEGKPGQKYEKIVMTIITSGVTLLIGYMVGKVL